jgi:cytochrome b561
MKPFLIVLGFLSALLIIAQLVLGQLILNGADKKLIKIHQHSGYTAVGLALIYIFLSLSKIASMPSKPKA